MKNILLVLYLISTLIFLNSCKSNRLDVKLNNATVQLEFINADKEFLNHSKEEVLVNFKNLESKLGDLFVYELSNDIRLNINETNTEDIYNFYNSEYIKELEQEKEKLWEELPIHEKAINKAFQYLSYHFGDSILPKQVFYINKLFSQINCSNQSISVGLENYISPESTVIRSIPSEEFYQWQKDRMDIQYLERDILMAWIQVHLFNEMDGKLAEHIIQAGKILYVLNASFPKAEPNYILRYTKEQYDWTEKNEANIWSYMVSEQMLFKSDASYKTNFLNEGPTTVGLSPDAPDRIGQYIGYKIVKGYMDKNKSLSLRELLSTEYNSILQTYKID